MTQQRATADRAARSASKPARTVAAEPARSVASTGLGVVLRLQRAAGNRAIGGLIQAKLRVNEPGDIYEQEADRVADEVMGMREPGFGAGDAGGGDVGGGGGARGGGVAGSTGGTGGIGEAGGLGGPTSPGNPGGFGGANGAGGGLISGMPFGIATVSRMSPARATPLTRIPPIQRICADCEDEMQRAVAEEEEESVQRQAINEEDEESIRRQAIDETVEEDTLQAKAADGGGLSVSPATEGRISSFRGGGEPLTESARSFFEPRFGYDFSRVRVHTGAHAGDIARSVNARAFTVGSDVVFGAGEYAPGTEAGRGLLAHELTHVVQQREGGSVVAPTPVVQRDLADIAGDVWDAGSSVVEGAVDMGKRGAEAVGTAVRDSAEWLVRKVSPELADLIAQGPTQFIKGIVHKAIEDWLPSLFGGVDFSLVDVAKSMKASFDSVLAFIADAARGGAKSCQAFAELLGSIRDFVMGFMNNPAIDMLKKVLGGIGGIIGKVVDFVAAPAFDLLKGILGGAWTVVKGAATTVWGWIKKVRDFASTAWDWVAEKLGLGDKADENSVWSLITRTANGIWTNIKATLAPVVAPLKKVSKALMAFYPLGQIYAIVKFGPKVVNAIQWLWTNRNDPDIVARAHKEMSGTILPQLLEAVTGLKGKIQAGAHWLVESLTSMGEGLLELLGGISSVPLLKVARGFIAGVAQGIDQLSTWAKAGLQSAADLITSAVTRVQNFVAPLKEVLSSIAMAIVMPPMIPTILAGWAWELVPRCWKAPILDFLLDIIVGAIEAVPQPIAVMFGPLWSLFKPGILAFLKGLKKQPADVKEKAADKAAKILRGSDLKPFLSFAFGLVKGFLLGIWEGVTDPFKAIWMVMQGLVGVMDYLDALTDSALGLTPATAASAPVAAESGGISAPAIEPGTALSTSPAVPASTSASPNAVSGATQPAMTASAGKAPAISSNGAGPVSPSPELGASVSAIATDLRPDVDVVLDQFWAAVGEYFSTGKGMTYEDLVAKFNEMWAAIQAKLASMGGKLADKFTTFLTTDAELDGELGEGIGWLAGTIVFQLLLDFLTAGTWAAAYPVIKGIAKFINWPMEFMGEALKVFAKVGTYLVDGVKGLVKMASKAGGGALKAVVEAVTHIGNKLVSYAERLMARFGRGAGRGGARIAERETAKLGEREVAKAGEKEAAAVLEKEGVGVGEKEAGKAVGKEGVKAAEKESAEKIEQQGVKEAEEKAGAKTEKEAAEEATELPRAVAESRAIEVAMQGVGAPVEAAVAALDARLKSEYRWIKRFEARRDGAGSFIWMIASETPIGFYDPRAVRQTLEEQYPGKVTSTTVPPESAPNVRLAGQRHPVTGIPFDERGFPIFDHVAAFDTKIPHDLASTNSRAAHFKEATVQLKEAIRSGQINKSVFDSNQLNAIENELEKIPGFTWHHHQDFGRMQLVPQDIHGPTTHIGGFRMREGQ